MTGDGDPDILLGAPQALFGDGIDAQGAVYLIGGGADLRAAGVRRVPEFALSTLLGSPSSSAGSSIATVPDVTADGVDEVLVGAPSRDFGLGASYVVYGGELPPRVPLDTLHPARPPFGARFLQNASNARLGAAVAGRRDSRDATRGEIAIAAPGHTVGADERGRVYTLRIGDPTTAPRNLTCELLPDRRVRLDWNVSVSPRIWSIYRNGRRIAGPLSGSLRRFVDAEPENDNVYVVEADLQPALRSEECSQSIDTIAPLDFVCRQVLGEARVRVSWSVSDRYERLELYLDGALVAELPPLSDRFELPAPPGEHNFELIAFPGALRVSCAVTVFDVASPPVENLICTKDAQGNALLSWDDLLYDSYVRFEKRPADRTNAGHDVRRSRCPRRRRALRRARRTRRRAQRTRAVRAPHRRPGRRWCEGHRTPRRRHPVGRRTGRRSSRASRGRDSRSGWRRSLTRAQVDSNGRFAMPLAEGGESASRLPCKHRPGAAGSAVRDRCSPKPSRGVRSSDSERRRRADDSSARRGGHRVARRCRSVEEPPRLDRSHRYRTRRDSCRPRQRDA